MFPVLSPDKTKNSINQRFTESYLFLKVENHGEVSNFLVEDYDAVLSFMNAETQNKKLKL
jgi:hypothetical protein